MSKVTPVYGTLNQTSTVNDLVKDCAFDFNAIHLTHPTPGNYAANDDV